MNEQQQLNRFGEELQKLLDERGMSIEELEEEMGRVLAESALADEGVVLDVRRWMTDAESLEEVGMIAGLFVEKALGLTPDETIQRLFKPASEAVMRHFYPHVEWGYDR